jgi:hypothetical protein
MPKSYRIRTQPGVDKSINIQLDQDFEYLEILSLKIFQNEIYTRMCSDYGVVVGRVLVNGGFGVPNAKVSVFIPISDEDEQNPIISELYPYKTIDDLNEDGYRYNLLPYEPSYTGHAATGTFPTREDVLKDAALVEVYDKYYKFTVKTNESGDYMIFGVPTGEQTIFMDVDLSDIGCFSLSPQDLINSGLATEAQVDGNKFRSSSNLRELPQVKTLNKIVQVQPLWGEPDICLLGITRVDFDLTASANVNIQPTSVFMGSLISTTNDDAVKKSCKPKINTGNMCELIAGPGQILAIRQTIDNDANGYPILEQYKIEQDGKIIDGDGTWLINLPMNLDYVTTNEFGEQVLSNDPNVGIPTTGKYRFKIKWQNEEGLQNNFMRGNYLVPNIKEHGWDSGNRDFDPFKNIDTLQNEYSITISPPYNPQSVVGLPRGGFFLNSVENTQQLDLTINGTPYVGSMDSIPLPQNLNTIQFNAIPIDNTQPITIIFTLIDESLFNLYRSYAFSLDWDDYGDPGTPAGLQMLNEAISCQDRFYKFHYNKVYTVTSFIDRYKNGTNRARHLGIKEITNRTCQSENNKLPVNDIVRNFDFIFFLFTLLLAIISPMLVIIIIVNHVLALLYPIVVKVVNFVIKLVNGIVYGICKAVKALGGKKECKKESLEPMSEENPFKRLSLPMLTYPDCEACSCPDESLVTENSVANSWNAAALGINLSLLSDLGTPDSYDNWNSTNLSTLNAGGPQPCGVIPTTAPDQAAWDAGAQQILAGAANPAVTYYKVPIWEEVGPFVSGSGGGLYFKRFGNGMTLGQSMNLANIRPRYSDVTARNRITITPNPSIVLANNTPVNTGNNGNSYEDLSMIILVDPGTKEQLVGKLITFYSPNNINDVNITGATQNQFGSNTITGTTLGVGTYTVPLTYMNSGGANVTPNITVVSTESEKEYLFKSGLEYFQVITGYTWGDLTSQSSPLYPQATVAGGSVTNGGVLWKYFLQNKISYLNPSAGSHTPPWYYFNDYENQEILILTRGVDPYTEKQEMRYDLSELFGQPLNTTVINGEFYLNIPIQQNSNNPIYTFDYRTPESHSLAIDNSNIQLFHPSIGFNVDVAAFTGHTTDAPRYYISTDKSTMSYVHGTYDSATISAWMDAGGNITTANQNFQWVTTVPSGIINENIGRADGSSFTITTYTLYTCYDGGSNILTSVTGAPPFGYPYGSYARCYAPSYYVSGNGNTPITTNINPSQRLIFRSDRLPTSDSTDTVGFNSFPLHQNNNFTFYTIDETGAPTSFSAAGDGVQGLNDLDAFGDLGTGSTSTIVETFSCEGMVPLKCYAGLGTSFTVLDPCEANQTGKDGQNKRVNGGCYYFVDDKLVKTIKDDIKYLAEWRTRFRIIFGACRGVFGHMFQNNWINGTMYMPTFNKQTTYNIIGEPSYRFCNDFVMFNDISNNFYYRCTPYADNSGIFIGGPTPTVSNFLSSIIGPSGPDDSANTRQILFPTTILDMGKRDEFISEICGDSDFSGRFLAKTLKSTSYQDSSDVLQLAILSRIVNSTFLEQVLSISNGGIEQFFDVRSGDRIDGDIAQSFSINSEYQVNPFIGGNYPDEYIFIGGAGSNNEPVFGIFYNTSEEEYKNRRALSPGFNIYSFQTNPPLQTYVGYPDTQEVPFYKWYVNPDNSIFGTNANEWRTDSQNGFYVRGYQNLDAAVDEYFKTTDMSGTFPNIYYGFITNFAPPPAPPAAPPDPPLATFATPPVNIIPANDGFLTGAPNFFYFGLKNGKTALNRFIKIYIETELD